MNIKPLGDAVSLMAPSPRHIGFQDKEKSPEDFLGMLGQAVQKGLNDTNSDQMQSEKMNLQMAVAPDTVNVHDVMIAAEKAQMSLDLTRTVIQKVVAAYQNITNLR